MILRPLTALLVFLFSSIGYADTHLFILSGQSNMAGLKPEKAFLPELKKLLPDADIQHVKFAKGGQPIRKWVKTFDKIAAKNKLPAKKDPGAFYDQTLKVARAKITAKAPRTITFLWMQGERDAKEDLSAA